MALRKLMRWYNPQLGAFEWREVPNTDEEALSLLDGYVGAEAHAAVYEEWCKLGSDIMAALIRAGETATRKSVASRKRPFGRLIVRPLCGGLLRRPALSPADRRCR